MADAAEIKYEYGVFLGADPEDISDMEAYSRIVIDAQYFSKADPCAPYDQSACTISAKSSRKMAMA